MFIRKTQTRGKATAETYFTYRLVASRRSGKKVRQIVLHNLGRHFSVGPADWPRLCDRIEALLSGQHLTLVAETDEIETLAQRYAARLIAASAGDPARTRAPTQVPAVAAHQDACPSQGGPAAPAPSEPEPTPAYAEVDTASLEFIRARSVGVEAVGLAAMGWLGIDKTLQDIGFNAGQRAAVTGSLIGRMAAPGSELSTYRWLKQRSALGELLDVDFEAMPLIRLYRSSDLLVKHRERIEQAVFARAQDLFELQATVTLYDLTNTYFEGSAAANPKAARGRSKEKRSDCPLLTLGLVLDGSGFVRRSRMFAGNAAESGTLEAMLKGLGTPPGALVIMDAGIATAANIAWLRKHNYRYLVVSRERGRQFDPDLATGILSASNETIKLQRVADEAAGEVRLYCHSAGREAKESAISARFALRFEAGLSLLAAGLAKPKGQKNLGVIQERIGRLKARSRGAGQHYQVSVTPDETGARASAIAWTKTPVDGSMLTHPGVYCLRTNETSWDDEQLWRTYMMLTDLEAVFRGLKSELGLRPVFHHKEVRAEGHLFITVLAYQLVQAIRHKLKLKGEGGNLSWTGLREIFCVQHRITATFRQRDGRTLHVRKATVAEPALRRIYDALEINPVPGGIVKHTV